LAGGCGEVEPEPVVLGALPVVAAGLLAEVLLLVLVFDPAITANTIRASTAIPAIQPHRLRFGESRRRTLSFNPWSLCGGSVKLGSDMATRPPLVLTLQVILFIVHQENPLPMPEVPKN
jgi:hypothetical protein